MADVQSTISLRPVPLERVGVVNLQYPVSFKQNGHRRDVIMELKISVDLPEEQRGAHISRFVQQLQEHLALPKETEKIEDLAETIAKLQLATHEYANRAVVHLSTRVDDEEGRIYTLTGKFCTRTKIKTLGIKTVGAIACPCSMAMTGGLSHNQRATLSLEIDVPPAGVDAESLLGEISRGFSTPVKLMLKRPDEKRLVEEMHRNPRFVEDVVREVVTILRAKHAGSKARVECVSHESIHPYDVFAEWEGTL